MSEANCAPFPSQIALGTNAAQNSESVGKSITGGPEGGPEDPEIIWSQLLLKFACAM
jgi:hypothetical protein